MTILRSAALAAFLLLSFSASASAHDSAMHEGCPPGQSVPADGIAVTGAYTRATLPNAPVGGGFMVIANHGTADDRLVSATSPVAGMTQIHEMKMEGDVMKMGALPDGLVIPAGQCVTLAPGGYHVMFMDLRQAFVEGTSIPVTLTFEKAGTIEIELAVGPIDADGPPHSMEGM